MANLSQERREKMLAFLETLKEQHSDDESLIALGEIERELKAKKYGLVWEEHEEEVDVIMRTHIPPCLWQTIARKYSLTQSQKIIIFSWKVTICTHYACWRKLIVET